MARALLAYPRSAARSVLLEARAKAWRADGPFAPLIEPLRVSGVLKGAWEESEHGCRVFGFKRR